MATSRIDAGNPHPNPLPAGEGVWPARVSRTGRAVLERVRQMEAVVASSGGGTVAAREQLRGARAVAREVVWQLCDLTFLPDDELVMTLLEHLAEGPSAQRPCSTIGRMVTSRDAGDTHRKPPGLPAWTRGEAPTGEYLDWIAKTALARAVLNALREIAPHEMSFDEVWEAVGGVDRCRQSSLGGVLGRLVVFGQVKRMGPQNRPRRYSATEAD